MDIHLHIHLHDETHAVPRPPTEAEATQAAEWVDRVAPGDATMHERASAFAAFLEALIPGGQPVPACERAGLAALLAAS